jgi:hypothetical protein
VDYLPPADEHNPYAAPQSSSKPDRPVYGTLGNTPISEPNPSARVRYDIIGEAWTLFKEKMGTWILITLVALVVFIAVYAVVMIATAMVIGFSGPAGGPGQQAGGQNAIIFIAVQIGTTLIIMFVTSFLMAGVFRAAINQVRGLPIAVGDLFQVGDVFFPVFLASILMTLAMYAGLILCIIPGLYIYARFSLTVPLIVDGRMSATQAMGLSWQALKGQVFHAFVFMFVVGLLAELGFLACGIGALFTIPLYPLCYAILYRDFFLWRPAGIESPWIGKASIDPEL